MSSTDQIESSLPDVVQAEPVPTESAMQYRVYPGRFYVLIAFALVAGHQSLSWMTFGTIPNETYKHFGLTDDEVTLLSGKLVQILSSAHTEFVIV